MAAEINDVRSQKEFRGVAFSGFQKNKVVKELLRCLAATKVEAACYWSAELVCAGHLLDLWDCIITYASKDIHTGSPRLPVYLAERFGAFKSIVANGYVGQELRLRNNAQIRGIFAEIIAVLCCSTKQHSYATVKAKSDDEFNMTSMASRLQAPSVKFAQPVFRDGDAKELFIAVNELAYHLSLKRGPLKACYWCVPLLRAPAFPTNPDSWAAASTTTSEPSRPPNLTATRIDRLRST